MTVERLSRERVACLREGLSWALPHSGGYRPPEGEGSEPGCSEGALGVLLPPLAERRRSGPGQPLKASPKARPPLTFSVPTPARCVEEDHRPFAVAGQAVLDASPRAGGLSGLELLPPTLAGP